MRLLSSVIVLLLVTLKLPVSAQDRKPFVLGVVDEIKSKQLAEVRTLNIYLPPGYDKDTARYPVIYLLDGSGDEDFIHIVGLVQFLNMIQFMPNSIIIGIANVDRKRDFTFPTTVDSDRKAYPTTGHSEKFISFLGNELQPYIQAHYRTTASKTIIGQSLGGLLATEILLMQPDMFTSYIIVSPSLWWSDEQLLKQAPRLLKLRNTGLQKVYISVGSEGPIMEGDAKQLAGLLRQYETKNFKVYFEPLPKEDHLTILHNAVYKALEVLNGK